MNDWFLSDMKRVENAIRDAGFVPYDQLFGYVMTGNSAYITRRDGARETVIQIDPDLLRQYLLHRKNA